ncbi:MAG: TrkA family potassium uptake protein [Desulfuromonadales bacterium]|nr:TrkA family potassium uptake protein [Desulfuromonadales bacterium]MBN2791410.1 TrkA family potassium uptake protein [Desulfuromonadales bacterium]
MMAEPVKYISVVIVGCGRLGSQLAGQLSADGYNVVIVDQHEKAFKLLPSKFSGFCITGDATEQLVMQSANLENADCLMAMTQKDTLNLMVALVARVIFSVPHVIARVYDPQYEDLFSSYQIETISPTKLSSQAFLQKIQEYIDI